MANEINEEEQTNEETQAKPTITIAEKTSTTEQAAKPTITIAERSDTE